MDTDNELLPCPHCGAEAVMELENEIYCSNATGCGAQVDIIELYEDGRDIKKITIAAWNRRANA